MREVPSIPTQWPPFGLRGEMMRSSMPACNTENEYVPAVHLLSLGGIILRMPD
jgi:hypothetical protein